MAVMGKKDLLEERRVAARLPDPIPADVHPVHHAQLALQRVAPAQELLALRVVVVGPHPAVAVAHDKGLANGVAPIDAYRMEAAVLEQQAVAGLEKWLDRTPFVDNPRPRLETTTPAAR